jgi:N-acetylated-alpha-linked acidic dipeptidase
VYEVWRRLAGIRADTLEPTMGDPGGGSDFAGFYNHLGIPHADWGFGGPGGVYHSAYDTPHWMETFGDPGYRYHAAAARVAAAMVLRLANADVLPYDYVEFARTMRRQVAALQRRMDAGGGGSAAALDSAVARMEAAAARFAADRDGRLRAGAPPRAVRASTNAALRDVERALTRPEGLRSRRWFRNLIYAADENNGYSTMVFPSVGEALRSSDPALAGREILDLAARFDAATAALEAARSALGGR